VLDFDPNFFFFFFLLSVGRVGQPLLVGAHLLAARPARPLPGDPLLEIASRAWNRSARLPAPTSRLPVRHQSPARRSRSPPEKTARPRSPRSRRLAPPVKTSPGLALRPASPVRGLPSPGPRPRSPLGESLARCRQGVATR
jgi:hypothetical protein